jgi:signal transduction histidine kinase
VANKIIAVLFITDGTKNAFTEEEKKLFHSIANHTAVELNKMSSIFSTDQKKIQTVLDSLSNGVLMINNNYELVMLNLQRRKYLLPWV